MPTKEGIVVGLDVGTTKVAVCAGQIQEGMIKIIGLAKTNSNGVRKGMVVDVEETVSSVSAAIETIEQKTGSKVENAIVSIGGNHITSISSKGIIAISRADGEITNLDMEKVISAAKAVALPPNREIIHVVPKSYLVDGQEGIKNPEGMAGIRLEVEANVIGGATSAIKNLTSAINQAGVKINDLIFSPLATAKGLLSRKQKEMGVMLVDLGAATTSFAIFEEGDILHAGVLPIGSLSITNDIAIGLRTSIENAEKIKIKYGQATTKDLKDTDIIEMDKFDPTDKTEQPIKYVADIIEARLFEIFEGISEQLKSIGKDGMLPAGIVFTGGGAKLKGLVEAAKEQLRLPIQIGHPVLEVAGAIDKIDDPVYANCVGLTLWGLESSHLVNKPLKLNFDKMGGLLGKAQEFFKQFLP